MNYTRLGNRVRGLERIRLQRQKDQRDTAHQPGRRITWVNGNDDTYGYDSYTTRDIECEVVGTWIKRNNDGRYFRPTKDDNDEDV